MAVEDTYNGDLVKIKQKVPAAADNDDTGLTAALEEAYAIINVKIEEADASAPLTGTIPEVVKLAEALMGAGLWIEDNIHPAQDKQFAETDFEGKTRRSMQYVKGEQYIDGWIDSEYGASSDDATDWAVHNKVERKFRPAAQQDVDYYLIDGSEGS